MLAMQYTIQLPADYDMSQVDARVEQRKNLFGDVPGLVHKSYLANDEDKIYAPLYIWSDIAGLRDFLLADLFHGVTKAFRRPRVRSWAVIDQVNGQFSGNPQFAIRESDPVPSESELEAWIQKERDNQARLESQDGLFLSVLGLDPDRWEILRYSLWRDEKSAPKLESDCAQTYRVLHV